MNPKQMLLKDLTGRKIILFGASGSLASVLPKFRDTHDISYIVDNDRKKWGTTFLGFDVHPPERLVTKDKNEVVLICSWWKKSICRQLLSYGFKPNLDFFIDTALVVDPSHYFHIFELYSRFTRKHGLSLGDKVILHVGVGHTLMVDILLALAGARVVACNLDDEMIFFPDATLKSHLYGSLCQYYVRHSHEFLYRLEDFVQFKEDGFVFTSDRITFLTLNSEHLPFRSETFDYVFSYDLLEHIASPEKVVKEQNRVLKHGACYYHHISPGEHRSDQHPFDLYRYSATQWVEICKRLGYFHNRWLACQFIECFSEMGKTRELEIHVNKDKELLIPDYDQMDPMFHPFLEKDFVSSTGYLRISGTA